MSKIFISYDPEDIEYVEELQKELVKNYFKIYEHEREGTPVESISAEIYDVQAMIVIWSQNAPDSKWIKNDLKWAKKRKPIFSIILDGKNLDLIEKTKLYYVEKSELPPKNFYIELGAATLGWRYLQAKPRKNLKWIILLQVITLFLFFWLIYDDRSHESLPQTRNNYAIETSYPDNKNISQVYVPTGCFMMGSDPQLDPAAELDEQPAHEVCLDAFLIDQYEVTNAAYQVFANSGGYEKREYWSDEGWEWKEKNNVTTPNCMNDKNFNQPQQPVVCVSWYEAEAYAKWRGGRLPTEAEWEYAARGSASLIYPYGNEFIDKNSNFCDLICEESVRQYGMSDGVRHTAIVGRYFWGKSWVGAYEMVGNVWEWVQDWYGFDYFKESPRDNPTGIENGQVKVVKGGAWNTKPIDVRGASRYFNIREGRDLYIGFRVVTEIP